MATKPEHLSGQARLAGTPALTIAGMTPESLSSEPPQSARTRMNLQMIVRRARTTVSLRRHDVKY